MKFSILLGIFAIIIAADTARANPIDPISFDGFDITPGLNGTLSATADPITPGDDYFILGFEATDHTGANSGNTEWFYEEFAVPVALDYSVTIESAPGSDSVSLSHVGYFITDTYIPLGELNFGVEPPTGSTGSPFRPLSSLNGDSLSAGGSVTADAPAAPLPPAGAGILALLAGLMIFRRVRFVGRTV